MNMRFMTSMSVTRSKRRWRGEKGVNIIEFALVFPLLMMTVLGIVDFAFVLHHNEVLTNAAREGARVATLPGYGVLDVQNRVNEYTQMGGIPGTPTTTVTATTIPAAGGTWPATTVNVAYTHDYLFIGGIATWFGGSFSDIDLEAEATMRSELRP